MSKYLIKSLAVGVIVFHCNNYGLLDKFKDPSGSIAGKRYIFVGSLTTVGNMSGLTNGSCSGNGIGQADCSCQDLAKAGGLIGIAGATKYVAWLSTSVFDMTCRINGNNANNCSNTGGPTWYNTKDEIVATGFADLFDGILTNQVQYTEQKVQTGATNVWTGTDANGLRAGAGVPANNCTDWSQNSSGNGTIGNVGATTAFWSNNNSPPTCGATLPVYCIGVP